MEPPEESGEMKRDRVVGQQVDGTLLLDARRRCLVGSGHG